MAILGSITLATLLLTLAYFAFLERTYLRDQAQEFGDVSIVRWRKAFSAIVGVLSMLGIGLLGWTIGQI